MRRSLIVAAIALTLLIMWSSSYVSLQVESLLSGTSELNPMTHVRVQEVRGQALVQRKGHWIELFENTKLYAQDRLFTKAQAEVELSFDSGARLRLLESSEVQLELWKAEDPKGPIYLNFIAGDFITEQVGEPGAVFITKNKTMFAPGHRPQLHTPTLVIRPRQLRSADPITTPQAPAKSIPQDKNPGLSVKDELKQLNAKDGGTAKEPQLLDTLNNRFIDRVVGQQREQFQKCQANVLREGQNSRGRMVIGFTIQSRGTVDKVKVIDSQLQNESFEACVASVFSRTKFPAFSGKDIIRSYPIVFE